jgi:hypothetical protein
VALDMGLLIHLLVLCLVGAILFWLIQLVTGLLPGPVAQPARVILFCILGLIAIGVLLGDVGIIAPVWRYR